MKRLPVLAVPVHLLLLSLSFFFLFRPTTPPVLSSRQAFEPDRCLRVYVADLPRGLPHPGLVDPDHPPPHDHPPYPENPLIKQYSAEYWLLASLRAAATGTAAVRVVADWREADVVFIPFFATLSEEMELGWGTKGAFRKKDGRTTGGRGWSSTASPPTPRGGGPAAATTSSS